MTKLKVLCSLAAGVICAYFEKYALLYALVGVAVMMDLVSGMSAALISGEGLSSRVLRLGFLRKLMFLLAVAFGTFLDVLLPLAAATVGLEIGRGLLFSAVISIYICIGESISIMENICRATGREPPALLKKILSQAREKM